MSSICTDHTKQTSTW